METERSAEHSVESRRSPNIQISSRYSKEVPSNMLGAIMDKLNELFEKMNRIERRLSKMDNRFSEKIAKKLFEYAIYPSDIELREVAEDFLAENHTEFYDSMTDKKWNTYYKKILLN
ncbi:hypothetical protein C2G38_2194436 [Gigaspora rosea]|uniref:Uncharacterized protein n=1 Tax=Gigaspora rosea TaxID=44941 RepID=A0A397V5V5_9GLOM|nr:hypothetical protein C2G38_2194436 [Gigaspora rosea]